MAREPMPVDGLDGMQDIPDPAAFLADRPAPPDAVAPAEPSPTRAQMTTRRVIVVAASLAWMAAHVASWGPRPDLGKPAVALTLALWVVLAAAGLVLVLGRHARGLPYGVRAVQGIVIVIPAAFAISGIASSSLHEPVPEDSLMPCLIAGCQVAIPALAAAGLVLRRSFLSIPAWRGAAIGAVCGLLGTFGIHAHCDYLATSHVIFAHGPPVLGCALVGAAFGALWGRA